MRTPPDGAPWRAGPKGNHVDLDPSAAVAHRRRAPTPSATTPGARPRPATLARQISFGVLGPLEVTVDGQAVVIPSRRQRALLVLLAMDVGTVVSSERLIERLWDGAPPPQAPVTLRSYVSNLRHALGGRGGPGGVLTTHGQGYALDVDADAVDSTRLRHLTEQGHEDLRNDRPGPALEAFDAAVGLWRGQPLAEVADHEVAQGMITALTELYLSASEGRFEALLATGRHLDALPGLEAFVAEHPLREGPRALQMVGLYRAGRTAEALKTHRTFRRLLRHELGIDPSPRLEGLLRDILEQAPALAGPQPVAPVPVPGGSGEGRDTDPDRESGTERAAGTTTPGRTRVIVGRRRELRVLTSHLDRLESDRRGAAVLVAGEPGIGKTTLLEALEAEARRRGMGVHVGRSPSATGAPPLWPWTQILDSVASALDDTALRAACAGAARPVVQLSPTFADRVGRVPVITGDNAQRMRFLLYEGVSAFLRAACTGPTVLLLDDLHWADGPSLELLTYLTPSLGDRGLLMVAAFRDLPADRTPELDATLATLSREDGVDEVELHGLDREQVAELATHLAGDADEAQVLDESLVSLLHERTGGNPFFIRQLGRLLLESGTGAQEAIRAAVPSGVRHVIDSRLRALSTPTTTLLRAAAVVGREFGLTTAAAAAGMTVEEALDACDEAGRHGLVDAGGPRGYRFVHALVHEAVAESVPPGRAVRLHAAVATELEQTGGTPDQLAEHMWRARDLVGARAVGYQVDAARNAMVVFAYERAEQYLRRGLDLVRRGSPPDPRAELHILLSLFRLIATERGWGANDAREVVVRARELAAVGALDRDTVGLWWSLWLYLLDRDDVTTAAEVAATLEDLSATLDDDAVTIAAHHMAALSEVGRNQLSAALARLQAARALADRTPNEKLAAFDEHLNVMLLLNEAYFAAHLGDAAGHRSAVEAAVALADADGRPFPRALARTLAATCAVLLPDPEYVGQLAADARKVSARFGFGWLEMSSRCAAACAEARLGGDVAVAIAQIEDILAQHYDTGRLGNVPVVLVMLADAHVAAGHLEDARACLRRAKARPGPNGVLMSRYLDRRLLELG